jgi:hypothetical protein
MSEPVLTEEHYTLLGKALLWGDRFYVGPDNLLLAADFLKLEFITLENTYDGLDAILTEKGLAVANEKRG